MRQKVDAFLGSTSDPAVYYDKLSQEQLEALDNNSLLPPLAVQWAREAEDGPLAFAVIDDVNQCRDLIKQSNDMIEKLNGRAQLRRTACARSRSSRPARRRRSRS